MYRANLAHNSTLICAILYTSKSDREAALLIWASRATGGGYAPQYAHRGARRSGVGRGQSSASPEP